MKPISIHFGGYQPPASVHNKAADVLGRALMARLGKAVQFNLDGNIVVSGHQAADLLTMIESGVMTMGYFSASYLAAHVPEFALLDLPFTINDRQAAYRILDGPLGQLLADKLSASTGFRLLGWWDNGFRHLTSAIRPIRTPMDCMGLRIRTLYSDVHQRVFKLLGFVPVALDVKELIVAVQSGAIDAQENPLTNIYNFGIHRLHRYISLSGHFFGVAVLLCHQASYDAWPTEVQRAVAEAASEASAVQRRFAAAEDDDVITRLRVAQNEIIHLTDAECALFVAAVTPVMEEQRQRFGDQLMAISYANTTAIREGIQPCHPACTSRAKAKTRSFGLRWIQRREIWSHRERRLSPGVLLPSQSIPGGNFCMWGGAASARFRVIRSISTPGHWR